MIVSATFVSASISNAKQERTVDNNNMAVVAAEMGIDYYKTAMINELNTNKDALIEFAEDQIKILVNDINEKKLLESKVQERLKEIQKNIAEKLKTDLEDKISDLEKEIYLDADIYYDGSSLFNSSSIKLDNDGRSVIVDGLIFGHNGEKEHDLGLEMEFILPDIIALDIDVDTNSDPGIF